jgi:hypothetical protein
VLFQTVLHLEHADPPLTFWLIEIEEQSAKLALKRNLSDAIVVARRAARDYFGADILTEEEIKNQLHTIDEGGRWFAAEDLS